MPHITNETNSEHIVSYCLNDSSYIDSLITATACMKRNVVTTTLATQARKTKEKEGKYFNVRKPSTLKITEVEDMALSHIKEQTVLVTGCSGKKHNVNFARADELYDSTRITFTKRIAAEENIPLFILSAKYGLIKQDHQTANYDKKMDETRAKELIDEVVSQLRLNKITSIVFFSAGVNAHYKALLSEACSYLDVELRMIGHSCMGGAKELPALIQIATNSHEAVPKNKILIEPIYSQEANGQLRFF